MLIAREQFAAYQAHPNMTYLDSAATTLKPLAVIEALKQAHAYGTVHRGIYQLAREGTQKYEAARAQVASWLGAARSEELVFTRGTTDAINLVAQGLSHRIVEGDEILLSVLEHHSNLVPWQMLARRCGARLRFAQADPQGRIDSQELLSLLSPRTRVVALSHMPNTTGRMQEFSLLFQRAKQLGAWCLLDGAQAISCCELDVTRLGCDFYTFSAHKLYGPTGLGFLWGHYEALEALAPRDGGGEMVERVELEQSSYTQLPLRLEAGTPAVAQVLTMPAVLELLASFDRNELLRHKIALTSQLIERLESIEGIQLFAEKGVSSLLLFAIEGIHPLDLTTLLDLSQVAVRSGHMCAQPALRRLGLESALRVSFGLYNDESDLERFEKALRQAIRSLR